MVKKLLMVAAMLALVLAVAVPAIAQVKNGTAQSEDSGNLTGSFSVQQSGSNSSQCIRPQQFGNTGSQQNGQGVLQYNSVADGAFGNIEPSGSEFTVAPVLVSPCEQTVQQSAAASH
jgi:hypothetical protein